MSGELRVLGATGAGGGRGETADWREAWAGLRHSRPCGGQLQRDSAAGPGRLTPALLTFCFSISKVGWKGLLSSYISFGTVVFIPGGWLQYPELSVLES